MLCRTGFRATFFFIYLRLLRNNMDDLRMTPRRSTLLEYICEFNLKRNIFAITANQFFSITFPVN